MDTQAQTLSFLEEFRSASVLIRDPRIDRKKLHPLENVLFIAFCSVICGGEGWEDMEDWGHAAEGWLAGFLDLSNGIPSDDTFARVFKTIEPQDFESWFRTWMLRASALSVGQVIAVDGKTACGAGAGAPHILSAYASADSICLGQEVVDGKSNEIEAIPRLLNSLDIKGQIVTIDAMGCQRAIAGQITGKGADYAIALKRNQPTLHGQVADRFAKCTKLPEFQTVEKDHGRIETRRCRVLENLALVDEAGKWPGLRMALEISRKREPAAGGPAQEETVYYICSRAAPPEEAMAWARAHWAIESKLHWSLDVVFAEDRHPIRKGNAPVNLSILKRLVINLLKKETTAPKAGLARKRKLAGWDREYLLKVIAGLF